MVDVRYLLPDFSIEDAVRIAREHFGIDSEARPLPGERDQNFHLTAPGGAEYVLKIANVAEEESVLDLQNRAMEHLAASAPAVLTSRLCRAQSGEAMVRVSGGAGGAHFVRLLTYVPGRLMASVRPHSRELLRSLGGMLAAIDRALLNFSHPAAQRILKWDLTHAGWIRDYLRHIENPARREIVVSLLNRFEDTVAPKLPMLRSSIIYNDANDYNILVHQDSSRHEVIGVIDFGDMVQSRTVCDLAVGMAYASLGKTDPLTAAAHVAVGYHAAFPLTDDELQALFYLYCIRICVTVTNSAYQRTVEPDNDYLVISEAPAWDTLGRIAKLDPEYAHLRLRHACGLPVSSHTDVVVNWLKSTARNPAPVVSVNLARESAVVDLSAGSGVIGNLAEIADVPALSRRIFDTIAEAGAAAGIGRYNEARVLTLPDVSRMEGNDGPEWRTVHLGIDVFLQPGEAVSAPFDAVIHSFANNPSRYDYGPTIVLEHQVQGTRYKFYTLYGHLSADSLNGLYAGRKVARGERIGSVGDSAVNGGWPPHLHFQIMTTMMEYQGDFPGNALPSLRDFWLDLCPDANLILRIPVQKLRDQHMSGEEISRLRSMHVGKNLSVSYSKPLQIVRGSMQYLIDEEGRAYLDTVNNVAHVGHCHPRVVRAAQRQSEVLNTNTRYLHENLARYAARLCALFPEPLRVCYFVCSGSEANELALRLARTFTGRRDIIVMEAGYHGNTTSLIDASAYKFDGPGGSGSPSWVHKVSLADPFRGKHRWVDPEAGLRYAQEIADAARRADESGGGVAAFLCEAMPGCGGQIVFPAGYLKDAYRRVRAAGGVCIADEVQTGFGRVGSHFWAFETQSVVPDIVTLGKPMGNGHPIGAVVTTPEIAAAFDNGMEYFNTYGGNPVSCTIGLAVLDVIRDEGLQERAATVGAYLARRLRDLMDIHPLIGDVRGAGLYLGVELVEDRATLTPAARQAAYVINRAREKGVLMSTDGPLHNVLKIKPPLVFSEANADFLAATLHSILQEL